MLRAPYLARQTPEEAHEAIRCRAEAMKGPLAPDVYLRRENMLAELPLTRTGGLVGWILAADRPDGSREHLCSCETLRKRALLARSSNSGRIDEVICYGVASVYCPPANRGQSHATDMLARLTQWMETDGGAAFSVLYSGIGKNFYGRLGWRARESAHVGLTPSHSPAGGVPDGVTLLKATDVEGLCVRDENMIRRRLSRIARQGMNAVAVVPDYPTMSWHLAKESFMSDEYYGKTPDICGASTRSSSGTEVWCIWTRWWYKPPGRNTMHILRLAVEDEDYGDSAATCHAVPDPEIVAAIASLLDVARVEASKWEMVEVQIWNPSSSTLAAAQKLQPGVQVIYRDSQSLPSLRVCDARLSEVAGSELIWTCNEKYAWC